MLLSEFVNNYMMVQCFYVLTFFLLFQSQIDQFSQLVGARISSKFTKEATHLILQPGRSDKSASYLP